MRYVIASEFVVVAKLRRNTFKYRLFTDIMDALTQFEMWANDIGIDSIDWENPTFTFHDNGFALITRNDTIIVLIAIDPDYAFDVLRIDVENDNE